jgi:hypothetical protein
MVLFSFEWAGPSGCAILSFGFCYSVSLWLDAIVHREYATNHFCPKGVVFQETYEIKGSQISTERARLHRDAVAASPLCNAHGAAPFSDKPEGIVR